MTKNLTTIIKNMSQVGYDTIKVCSIRNLNRQETNKNRYLNNNYNNNSLVYKNYKIKIKINKIIELVQSPANKPQKYMTHYL